MLDPRYNPPYRLPKNPRDWIDPRRIEMQLNRQRTVEQTKNTINDLRSWEDPRRKQMRLNHQRTVEQNKNNPNDPMNWRNPRPAQVNHQPTSYPPSHPFQKLQETKPEDFIIYQKNSSKKQLPPKTARRELIDLYFQLGELLEDAERNGENPVVIMQLHEQLLLIDNILKQQGPVLPPGGGPIIFSPPPEEVVLGGVLGGGNLWKLIQQGAKVLIGPLQEATKQTIKFAKTPQGAAVAGGLLVLTTVAIYLGGDTQEERLAIELAELYDKCVNLLTKKKNLVQEKIELKKRRRRILRGVPIDARGGLTGGSMFEPNLNNPALLLEINNRLKKIAKELKENKKLLKEIIEFITKNASNLTEIAKYAIRAGRLGGSWNSYNEFIRLLLEFAKQ